MDKNMIKESDIVFVTTTLYTKWLDYQSKIIKRLFPESQHIIVDGRGNWPNSWFYWIDEIKKSDKKYYIHIDEDFFITSKDELLKVVQKMENENIDLMGCPDGYQHYRGANPVAINTLIMFGRVDDIKRIDVDFRQIKFTWMSNGWNNSFGLHYKEFYSEDFNYKFTQNAGSNFTQEQEPYYAFIWYMKNQGCKFDYLYPHFDDRFKSTNPRIGEGDDSIGIHMWYTRQWNSTMDVHGLPNIERYNRVEKFIKDLYDL
jgi:hypothetical protein